MFIKGNRVKHPKKHDWGIGEVLEDSNDKTVYIHFENAGKKQLSLEYVQPIILDGHEAISTELDNLLNQEQISTRKSYTKSKTKVSPPYSEKDLDAVLEKGFIENPSFADWFLSKTRFNSYKAKYKWSRSDHPWGRFTVEVKDEKTGKLETVTRDSETDVLIVYEADELNIGLHIENKLADGHFTEYQPETYSQRAREWLNNDKYGNYSEFETILVSPVQFYKKNYKAAKHFDNFISYEDIADFLPEFRKYLNHI